jgi:long-chain acyl-CoA synthetase
MDWAPPALHVQGAVRSSRDVAAIAAAWRRALPAPVRADGPLAMVMANDPESVALFFALSSFPGPVVLLPPDLDSWRSDPPLPADTRVVLAPGQAHLAPRALGLVTTVLPEARPAGAPRDGRLPLATPGFVLFTSGTTGVPRPVYRPAAGLLAVSRALTAAVGLGPGDGIIATLPLARAFGLNHGLVAAAVLGSTLALLPRFDHDSLLRLFASGEYRYWAGTPVMADALTRSPRRETPAAPDVCTIGGRIPPALAPRFRERFGIPLRQIYGTTEAGTIAVDGAPPAEVRPDTCGRPRPGVAVRIGDDPRRPEPPGTPGRIWLSSPEYLMAGHGVPPDVVPVDTVDGWWATPDVGHLDEAGRLTVSGRLDDCFRTAAGRVVDPSAVARALDGHPGITDAVAVPLPTPGGPVLGVLVEAAGRPTAEDVRRHLARALPPWSQPRAVAVVPALPRLASGRIDRRACIALVERPLGDPAPPPRDAGGHAETIGS